MKEIMWKIRKITFVDIDEVFTNRKKFREEVMNLDEDTLEVYKWYFYHQLCLLSHKKTILKDLMWEYLVGKNVELELLHQYRIYKGKRFV